MSLEKHIALEEIETTNSDKQPALNHYDLAKGLKLFESAKKWLKPINSNFASVDDRTDHAIDQHSYDQLSERIMENHDSTSLWYGELLQKFTLLTIGIIQEDNNCTQYRPRENYQKVIDLYVSRYGFNSVILIDQILQWMSNAQTFTNGKKYSTTGNDKILKHLYNKIEPYATTENKIAIFANIIFGRQHKLSEWNINTLSKSEISILGKLTKEYDIDTSTILHKLKTTYSSWKETLKLVNPAMGSIIDTWEELIGEFQNRLDTKLIYNRTTTDILIKLLSKSKANTLLSKYLNNYIFIISRTTYVNSPRWSIPA